MRYYDYQTVAREAKIPADKLEQLQSLIRQEFPNDEMMYELHLLRACMAIRDGLARLEDIVDRIPATK